MADAPEFVREYVSALEEDLTNTAKVVIDTLTTLAAENVQHAPGVAAALLNHANNVSSIRSEPRGGMRTSALCFGVSWRACIWSPHALRLWLSVICSVAPSASSPRSTSWTALRRT